MRSFVLLLLIACISFVSCHKNEDDSKDREYEKIADRLYLDGHREASIRFLDSVYASGNVSPLGAFILESHKTQYYSRLGNFAKSLEHANKAVEVLRKHKLEHKYPKEYTHALLEKGHVYADLEKKDSAYNCYMEGYSFVYATGNVCFMHEFDYFMGMMLYRQSKYTEARRSFIRSFLEADACSEGAKPYYRMQELLGNIGLTFRGDSATYYFDSCLSFIEKNKDKFPNKRMGEEALAVCGLNRAYAYEDVNNFKVAEESLVETIRVLSGLDGSFSKDRLVLARLELALVYSTNGERGKLRNIWMELSRTITDSSDISLRVGLGRITYSMYASEKNFQKAYETLYAETSFRDSLDNISRRDEQANTVEVMRNKEQEYKIGLLTSNARLQRTYLWISIALSCLAVIVVLLVYGSYKRTKRTNKVISDQKQALERSNSALEKSNLALEESISALDRSNREKNKILNVVAHDLRSPVSAVAYLAESVVEDGEDSAVDPVSALTMIKNSSLNSLALINELLVFARDEQEGLLPEKTDMAALLQAAMDLQVQKAADKKVKLALTTPPDTVIANVDKNKMTRVMSNLIDNAIKFSRAGSVVQVGLQKDNDGVLLQVQDSGIGIPPHLLPELFEMFTPSGRKGTKGERSFGLGLSICRQIAEAHGGKIWVESSEGVGSTFYVRLPLA